MPVERLTFTYRYTLGTIGPHFLLLLEIVNPQGCVSSVHVYSPSGYISFWLWPCIAICIVYLCIHYKNITVYVSDLAQHHSVSVYTMAGHFCDFFSQEEYYSQARGKLFPSNRKRCWSHGLLLGRSVKKSHAALTESRRGRQWAILRLSPVCPSIIMLDTLSQWLSTFPVLWPSTAAPHVVGTPTINFFCCYF